jgi:hypothetical protein
MKIKDLPTGTNLQQIKVKLPKHIYLSSSLPNYGIKNVRVYLMGWMMGDFFVKINKKSTQIYPMFWGFGAPDNIDEWECFFT